MNVAARVGMTVGATALGALGAGLAIRAMHGAYEGDAAKVREQTAEARTTFDAWDAKFDKAFPGGKLDTPQDHQALEKFLKDNPAPKWLEVKHEGFTEVHTKRSWDEPMIDWPARLATDAPGMGIGIGISAAAGGAVAIGAGITKARSTAGTLAGILGGAALLSVGAIAAYMDIGVFNADTDEAERTKLLEDMTSHPEPQVFY